MRTPEAGSLIEITPKLASALQSYAAALETYDSPVRFDGPQLKAEIADALLEALKLPSVP